MATTRLQTKRSFTGHHNLLPASHQILDHKHISHVPNYTLISWTFGRGSVIWRIWPAVLLHTIFATIIVTVSLRTQYKLDIPNIMLTVLGVVIGFVISYRASSGYDRYWMGRTCWSDIIRHSRTMGRLIWFHVPLRLSPKTGNEAGIMASEPTPEMIKVMAEKRMALDLVEGFAVTLKHHIRGEPGIYFEDLYHLVRPLHDHNHPRRDHLTHSAGTSAHEKTQRNMVQPLVSNLQPNPSTSAVPRHPMPSAPDLFDPVPPSVNSYGSLDPSDPLFSPSSSRHHLRRSRSTSSRSSDSSQHQPLLPSTLPKSDTVLSKIYGDLIPFASFVSAISHYFKRKLSSQRPLEILPPNVSLVEEEQDVGEDSGDQRKWDGPIHTMRYERGLTHAKHRPRVAGGGDNLPLSVLRNLSEWCSVLEDRGTVPGTSLGAMIAEIANFEDSLSTLEKILTTPLPFVYSVHIKHTVWLYLFFLPFQLVNQFQWYTIPGVGIAAFIYLGFLAAGEEIEQPFGYDENDLDLDLFCREIIHADIEHLKMTPCLNAYLGPHHPHRTNRRSMTLVEAAGGQEEDGGDIVIGPTS